MNNQKKYFIDTNGIIALLNGNENVQQIINGAEWLGISVISILEFRSYSNLLVEDINLFNTFLQRVFIENIQYPKKTLFIETISSIRISYKLKLPDAIIAASAIYNDVPLISNDAQFNQIKALQTINF